MPLHHRARQEHTVTKHDVKDRKEVRACVDKGLYESSKYPRMDTPHVGELTCVSMKMGDGLYLKGDFVVDSH